MLVVNNSDMWRHDSLETWSGICKNSCGIALAAQAVSTEGTNQSVSYKVCNSATCSGGGCHGCEIQFAPIRSFPSHGISLLTIPSHPF